MPTALDVARTTVARSPVNYVRNGKSYCQTFAGNFWETHFGRPTPNSYPNATAARKASGTLNSNPETAPPGAYHYFDYGADGHVGVALGSGLMASGTGRTAGSLEHLGKNVHVHRVATYGLPYLGWSYTNGNRARITGLTDANAPAGPNVRTVKSNATARRRVSPDAGAALTPKDNPLAAGSSHRITKAYLTGVDITQNGTTTDIWFEVNAYGWAWAGGFTSQSLDGIPEVIDARPKPPPVEPEPIPEPEPEPQPDPEPEPEPVPEPLPEPIPDPEPIPEPSPDPTPAPAPTGVGVVLAIVGAIIAAIAAWIGLTP